MISRSKDPEVLLLNEITDLKNSLQTARHRNRAEIAPLSRQSDNAGLPIYPNHSALQPVYQLRAHATAKVLDVAWTSTDAFIIVVNSDGTLIVWDAHTGLIHNILDVADVQPLTVDSPDPEATVLFCGGLCGNVVVYRHKHRPPEDGYSLYENREVYEHSGSVNNVLCAGDAKLLTSAVNDGVLLWDVNKVKVIKRFPHPDTDVQAVSQVEPDLPTFLTGTVDGVIRLWDSRTGPDEIRVYEGHQSDVTCLRPLPTAVNFVSGSEDTYAHLYDLRTDAVIERYSEPQNFAVRSGDNESGLLETGSISSSRSTLAAAATSDPAADRPIAAAICDLAVSSSGRLMIAGCRDGVVYYWDLAYSDNCLAHDVEGGPVVRVTMANNKMGLVMATWDAKCRVRLMRPHG